MMEYLSSVELLARSKMLHNCVKACSQDSIFRGCMRFSSIVVGVQHEYSELCFFQFHPLSIQEGRGRGVP